MGLNLRPHNYQKGNAPGEVILQSKDPYIRFVCGTPDGEDHRYPIIAQRGRFYTDGGDVIKHEDIPEWFWIEARKVSEEGRKAVRLKLPEEEAEEPEPEPEKVEKKQEAPPLTLVDAIYSLDREEDDDWTKSGMPHLKRLEEKMGRFVSRAEVDQAAPDYTRPAKE